MRATPPRSVDLLSEHLLELLTVRQHVAPHRSIRDGMTFLVETAGISIATVEMAFQRLGIDPVLRLGRLRRTELTQLARTVGRLSWREPAAPQPTDAETTTPRCLVS